MDFVYRCRPKNWSSLPRSLRKNVKWWTISKWSSIKVHSRHLVFISYIIMFYMPFTLNIIVLSL